MKHIYFKIFLVACFAFMANYVQAQLRLGDKPEVGQTFVQDAATQLSTLSVNFNTNRNNSTWTQVNDSTATISWSKCQNNRGFGATIWVSDSTGAATIVNDDLRVRPGRWRSNENPARVASIDSLQAMLLKHKEITGNENNSIDKPSVCLFDVAGDPTNQVYGIHPGIYKKLEHEMVFTFSSQYLASDVSFILDTYDAGNTGATATYELQVTFGSTNVVVPNIYVTGSGPKLIKLAEATGLNISDFNGRSEVHVFLRTNGTGTEIATGKYDPTVSIDDILVSFAFPVWTVPAASPNEIVNNANAPLEGALGVAQQFGVNLQTKGRRASLSIIDNLFINGTVNKSQKPMTFLETGGVKAKDSLGNYTVDVPYTLTPAVYDQGTVSWSSQSIVIPAPDDVVNDDIMFFFEATPAKYPSESYRLELSNGSRIFYDVHVQATPISLDSLTASGGELVPAFKPEVTEYMLNVPAGTTAVEFAAYSSDSTAVITLPDASGLSDGGYYNVSVLVADPTGATIKTYNVGIHVQSDKEILFVSNSEGVPALADAGTLTTFDALRNAGYSVTLGAKLAINTNDFNFTPYLGMVIGAGVGSSWVNSYAIQGYPIPAVTLQHDAPRSSKYGWVGTDKDDNREMNVAKTSATTNVDSVKMKILNNSHFITKAYQEGDLIEWQNGTFDNAAVQGKEVKSYQLFDSIPTAFALGKLPIEAAALTSWWAIPEGSDLRTRGADGTFTKVRTNNRIVLLNLITESLESATSSYDEMLTNSLAWALGYDSDATLASLTPSVGSLTPVFAAGKTEYQLNLPMGTTAVSLSATATSPIATVELPGELSLTDGMNAVMSVVVTSADSSATTTYNVTVHVQTASEILFVSNSDGVLGAADAGTVRSFETMTNAGYSVTLVGKLGINTNEFDYTPYSGLVIGAGVGSSWVNGFAIQGYPIPAVTMQHDAPRSSKWGWLSTDKDDNKLMNVAKTAATTTPESVKMEIGNANIITQGYQVGELLEWQNGTFDIADLVGREVKSYDLSTTIPSAIGLGKIPIEAAALTNWWAIPESAVVHTRGADGTFSDVTLNNRIVLLTVFAEALPYATSGYDTMLIRSLNWVMDKTLTAVNETVLMSKNVEVYPNPAYDYATVRFELTKTENVKLALYDILGHQVTALPTGRYTAGAHEINLNTSSLAKGLYFCVLQAGNEVSKGKLNVLK